MSIHQNISSLQSRYLKSCKEHGLAPNSGVLMWLLKAVEHGNKYQKCTIEVCLDQLEDHDLSPLMDILLDDHCHGIDILCESSCSLNPESILSLMNKANSKLRVVDLQNASLGKDILCDIFQIGLQCQILKVRFNEFRNLNFPGKFMQLLTLNLDFCSLTNLEIDCFTFMPNLMHISMCGTRITNLWTTTAALSRLKSLVELRFQSCPCCKGTESCPALKPKRGGPNWQTTAAAAQIAHSNAFQRKSANLVFEDDMQVNDLTQRLLAQTCRRERLVEEVSAVRSSDDHKQSIILSKLHIEVSPKKLEIQESESPTSVLDLEDIEDSPVSVASKLNVLQNPSPICFENHYREYMIASLPSLQVLDNFPIKQEHRETAETVFSKYFEYLPYKRHYKESVTSLLHMREMGARGVYKTSTWKRHSSPHHKSKHFYSRSLSAAKLGSRPVLSPVSHGDRRFRPRQFEYHPSVAHLMGFGTLDGEVIVINHEKGKVLNHIAASRANCSAISLCWFNKHPSKLLAGFDNGFLRLYDINQATADSEDSLASSRTSSYDDFHQLTSLHVNATDEKFLASGYSRKLAVYDVCTGRRLHLFTNIHQETINVAKFAHHSPHLLVTSSYDRHVKMWDIRQNPTQPCYTASSTGGNVMVCFSPDDLYLLVSAVDNEVQQLLAVDGILHTRFEICPSGSSHNFTRSYYMNGRDYIVSGSSDESVVRICCAQTGRRLRDVHLEDSSLESSIYVQSLRGDPFRVTLSHGDIGRLCSFQHTKRDHQGQFTGLKSPSPNSFTLFLNSSTSFTFFNIHCAIVASKAVIGIMGLSSVH
ncbi:OLC1v1011526C1 [Oldenlandia corymbosa var. corymbosa]|uniref:OLC1v1011526C1 n=1 Tax=Oldenlandia corymbosa var. corymbosa TaxID=529605 RepID=A0AAV1DU20_OLDCO|nr:OLC1v1011526C1 [Oldenlandia corymbosa var. corymbosa]